MEIYKDESYTLEERAVSIVSEMTLDEKIYEIGNHGAAIKRLGIPYYNYWNEASHGAFGPFKFRTMNFTSFPVCLAMSQSWDRELIKRVTTAISDEIRAYHNQDGDELHYWCPTINLARDPRNGRSDENFGEDPFLTGKMAVSYIQGMQGEDPVYYKTVATPKHYMMNSGENNRHCGSSNADMATIREYYAKVYEYAVKEGKAGSIMTSYNRINGVPASCNEFMLTTLLREEWGFDGMVVSDAGAVGDVFMNPMFVSANNTAHYYTKDMEEAVALCVKAGTDNTAGKEYRKYLRAAYERGLISEDEIDRAAVRTMLSRFKAGLLNETDRTPYFNIGMEHVCSKENTELAVEAANDSIVLLKNENSLLPVDPWKVKRVLVVGPNARYRELGGYSAGAENPLVDTVVNVMTVDAVEEFGKEYGFETVYEKGWCTGKEKKDDAIPSALPGVDPEELFTEEYMPDNVTEEEGKKMFATPDRHFREDPDKGVADEILFARVLEQAQKADLVIFVAGTDSTTASEEHDRMTLDLPYGQNEKILTVLEKNPNTVIALTTLGTVTGEFLEKAPAILNAHYCGQAQGTAIANVIFGKVNPNAKLTCTWYHDLKDLPDVNDYGIKKKDTYSKKGRTYMYYDGKVNFPFGYGLSYTTYEYCNLRIKNKMLDANEVLEGSVDVTNAGKVEGKEIVEIYVRKKHEELPGFDKPVRQLKGFVKVNLKPGETKTVPFTIPLHEISFYSNFYQKMIVEEGEYELEIGKNAEDIVCEAPFQIKGDWKPPLSNIYCTISRYVYKLGETGQIQVAAVLDDATHLKERDYQISYQVNREGIVEVQPDGMVQAIGAGVAQIIVTVRHENQKMQKTIPVAVK